MKWALCCYVRQVQAFRFQMYFIWKLGFLVFVINTSFRINTIYIPYTLWSPLALDEHILHFSFFPKIIFIFLSKILWEILFSVLGKHNCHGSVVTKPFNIISEYKCLTIQRLLCLMKVLLHLYSFLKCKKGLCYYVCLLEMFRFWMYLIRKFDFLCLLN